MRSHKSAFRVIAIVLLLFFAIHGIVTVGEYIGYASFAGKAGNIYQILVKHHIPVDQWAGLYGVAVRVDGFNNLQSQPLTGGDIDNENLLFSCLEPGVQHEIYASVYDDLDLSSASPATPEEIDQFYGLSNESVDTATNTFIRNVTFELGTLSLTVPGTYTYKLDDDGTPQTFATGIIKDAQGRIGLVILITGNFTQGFNGDIINYQALLPVYPAQQDTEYFFFTDPNDQCPAGEGEEPPLCAVEGNVTTISGNPLGGVIVDVAGSTTLSDQGGGYSLATRSGSWNIYGIKEGYKPYVNNITCPINETISHNIVMVDEVNQTLTGVGPGTDNPGDQTQAGIGPGIGPGQDVGPGQSDGEGPGEIPPVPFVEQPKQIEGTDYIISMSELKRKIRIDTFHQEAMYLYSFKKQPITLTFELHPGNLSKIISLDRNRMVIGPNSNDELIITIYGRPPEGTYEGNLTIDGEINATIPIEIEILPKDRISVEALMMSLETSEKSVFPGNQFKFKADLRNLLIDQQYPVNTLFTIQPIGGGPAVWTYQANVYLKTAFSLIRTVDVPKDLAPDDYVLHATANYLGLSSSTSTIFTVSVPFWQRATFGLARWLWMLILGILAAGAIAGYFVYRNIQGKKKYHLKIELSELPKPSPRNVFVGKIAETEHKTYMNLENFKVHTIVAGSTGGGKSVSAQVIVEEALDKDVAVICFDPTAQWTGMLRPCKDKTMLSLYPLFGMKKNDAKAYNGNIRMITNPREKIDIRKYVKPGEIQVFACNKLDPKDMDVVVANAIREIFHANLPESKPLKVLFVFDEVHRLLPKFGGSGDGFLQIERACREFRKWGLGVVLVSQVLSDFMGTIKANINTEVQMRTRDEGDLERVRQKYGEEVLRSLVKATVGSGMVENPAYNRGRPYFVAFRPLKHSVERLSDEEIEQYNKYNDLVDELDHSLQQLETEGVDVFDLKLELKLALDKVKQGNFNMVQIYLDGLKPRIDKQWEKLGKQPEKFERELVSEDELKAELAKAQQERDKYVEENKEEETVEKKKEWGWSDNAPPDKLLNLKNGMVVLSIASLYDEMSAMKDEDWAGEVSEGQNTIADWVLNATGLERLAANLYSTTDKAESLKILEAFKKGGEDALEDKKPPGKAADPAGKPEPAQPSPTAAQGTAQGDDGLGEKKETAESAGEPEEPGEKSLEETADENGTPGEDPSGETEGSGGEESAGAPGTVVGAAEPGQDETGAGSRNGSSPGPVVGGDDDRAIQRLKTDNPDEFFRLEDGSAIRSVFELKELLPRMPEEVFRKHVGSDYNHFADWVRGVFKEEDLAERISSAQNKDDMLAVIG